MDLADITRIRINCNVELISNKLKKCAPTMTNKLDAIIPQVVKSKAALKYTFELPIFRSEKVFPRNL